MEYRIKVTLVDNEDGKIAKLVMGNKEFSYSMDLDTPLHPFLVDAFLETIEFEENEKPFIPAICKYLLDEISWRLNESYCNDVKPLNFDDATNMVFSFLEGTQHGLQPVRDMAVCTNQS